MGRGHTPRARSQQKMRQDPQGSWVSDGGRSQIDPIGSDRKRVAAGLSRYSLAMKVRSPLSAFALLALISSCGGLQPEDHEAASRVLPGRTHYVEDFPARAADGSVHVVVEIPAGTDAKWEVTKPDGKLAWQIKDGKPRVVQYLGYPGNYGMVPRTILPKELGGDGDPLDVLVLGPALRRGTVAKVRIIGVLELLDGGEQDDKLLGVLPGTPLGDLASLAELDTQFPGVTSIVQTWFENYKGKDEAGQARMVAKGFAGKARADEILEAAIAAYGAETATPAATDH